MGIAFQGIAVTARAAVKKWHNKLITAKCTEAQRAELQRHQLYYTSRGKT